MSHYRWIASLLVVASCAEPEPEAEQAPPSESFEPAPEPALVTEEVGVTYPAPRSVLAQPPPAPAPLSPREHIASGVGPDRANVTVFAGTVRELRAERRSIPGTETSVATVASIDVLRVYCGESLSGTAKITYPGGTLPTGETSFDSEWPRDLDIGRAHVFLARRRGDELLITTARYQVFGLEPDAAASITGIGVISGTELEGVCE